LRDFTMVAQTGESPFVMVANVSLPIKNLRDLVAMAKAKPGTLAYGSTGSGGTSHLMGELLKSMAGIDVIHVPYKGLSPALTEVIGGQIQYSFGSWSTVGPFVKAGKLRAIAVTTGKRFALLPDLPTIAESGYPGFEALAWNGLLVPAATQSWLPTLLEATQHHLVAASPSPTALVRAGRSAPERVVLALNTAQARRPSSAGIEAAQLAIRAARGTRLLVVAAEEPAEQLRTLWRDAEVVVRSPQEWLAEAATPSDLLVMSGGRNGALGTARLTKAATALGCSMAIVADRASVSASDRAAEGLGLVTSRTARA
jgi:hypothetical protein